MPPSIPGWARGFRPPWQAGPGPGRGKGAVPSTRAHQELLAGLPTTSTLQPCPLPALSAHRHRHRQSLWSSCCCPGAMPPLYNLGTSSGLCPLLRAGMGPRSASQQPPQGFWPHHRSRGCPPVPGTLPTRVPSQPQWDGDPPERAQPAAQGRGCPMLRAQCWAGGWGRAAR